MGAVCSNGTTSRGRDSLDGFGCHGRLVGLRDALAIDQLQDHWPQRQFAFERKVQDVSLSSTVARSVRGRQWCTHRVAGEFLPLAPLDWERGWDIGGSDTHYQVAAVLTKGFLGHVNYGWESFGSIKCSTHIRGAHITKR
jgi:hypothetical protein